MSKLVIFLIKNLDQHAVPKLVMKTMFVLLRLILTAHSNGYQYLNHCLDAAIRFIEQGTDSNQGKYGRRVSHKQNGWQ